LCRLHQCGYGFSMLLHTAVAPKAVLAPPVHVHSRPRVDAAARHARASARTSGPHGRPLGALLRWRGAVSATCTSILWLAVPVQARGARGLARPGVARFARVAALSTISRRGRATRAHAGGAAAVGLRGHCRHLPSTRSTGDSSCSYSRRSRGGLPRGQARTTRSARCWMPVSARLRGPVGREATLVPAPLLPVTAAPPTRLCVPRPPDEGTTTLPPGKKKRSSACSALTTPTIGCLRASAPGVGCM